MVNRLYIYYYYSTVLVLVLQPNDVTICGVLSLGGEGREKATATPPEQIKLLARGTEEEASIQLPFTTSGLGFVN